MRAEVLQLFQLWNEVWAWLQMRVMRKLGPSIAHRRDKSPLPGITNRRVDYRDEVCRVLIQAKLIIVFLLMILPIY